MSTEVLKQDGRAIDDTKDGKPSAKGANDNAPAVGCQYQM
jgi:hypothetical protein